MFDSKEKLVSKGKTRQAEIRKLYKDMPVTSGKLIMDRMLKKKGETHRVKGLSVTEKNHMYN